MSYYLRFSLILFIAILPRITRCQSNVTVKYFGLTIHPFGDDLAQLQPYKLDRTAHFVFNIGGLASFEKYLWEDIVSATVAQGVFTDCSGGLSGASFLGIKGVLLNRQKSRLSIGLGPLLVYRKDWQRFPEYVDTGLFHKYHSKSLGDIQYKIFWYGVEIEYDKKLSDKIDLSFTITPGLPYVMTFAAGIKYWINKDFKKKVKLVIPK